VIGPAKSTGELNVAAILLAAGHGKRLGKAKALLELNGEPLAYHVFNKLVEAGFTAIVTILNPDVHAELAADVDRFKQLTQCGHVVINQEVELGTLHSIRLGVQALNTEVDAAMFMAVDHPFVKVDTLRQLKNAADLSGIVVPTFAGKRGHPPVFGSNHFATLHDIPLDEGARGVIRRSPGSVIEVETDDEGVHWNINTTADWEQRTMKNQ